VLIFLLEALAPAKILAYLSNAHAGTRWQGLLTIKIYQPEQLLRRTA